MNLRFNTSFTFLFIFFIFISTVGFTQPANSKWLIFGSLGANKQGIALSSFDTISGKLSAPRLIKEAQAPGFFVVHPDGKHIYTTVSLDTMPKQSGGALSAYGVDPRTGDLTFLNSLPSRGKEPCHISLDGDGTHVLAANYTSANAIVCSILPDGSLGKETGFAQSSGHSINKERQNEAHAHSIRVDPSNKYALVCDLGADKILIYKYDKNKGTLKANQPAFAKSTPGAGPRHSIFHPNGKYFYVANELLNTISVYTWNAKKGELAEIQQISTLPADFKEFSKLAEIAVYPNGKYLYCTNRGHNTIAVFNIDQKTGKISFLQHIATKGNMPRNFTFDPSNGWLILTNHASNNIVVYKIDKSTGMLTQNGEPMELEAPFCVRFLK